MAPRPTHLKLVQGDEPTRTRARRAPRRSLTALAEPRDLRIGIDSDAPSFTSSKGVGDEVVFRRYGRRNGPRILIVGDGSVGRFVADRDGWWRTLVAPGGAIDLNHFTVLGLDLSRVSFHAAAALKEQSNAIASALLRANLSSLSVVIGCGHGAELAMMLARDHTVKVQRLCLIQARFATPFGFASLGSDTPTTLVEFGNPRTAFAALAALSTSLSSVRASHALQSKAGERAYLDEQFQLAPILKALSTEMRL